MLVARLGDGLVLEANDGFAALIARPLGEIFGADVFGLNIWGETGPRRARELLTDTGLIDGYDTSVRSEAGDTRIVRAWAETVDGPETLVVIRASDVDGRATAKTRYLELRETEVRFRAMVEQMPAITYTQVEDPTTETGLRDVYVSPQIEPLLGVPADEWLRDPDAWLRQLHPEDRARVCEQIRSTPRGRFHSEYRMIARDGSIRWFRDEAIHVEDPANGVALWQGVMLDVTEAKLAADHHAATEAKYRALVEQLPAVVYLGEYGDDGEWLYISPHIETVLGYTPQEWLAHPAPMGQLTHPEDLDRARAEEERSLRDGTPYRAEYRMRARDGRWVWILDEAGVVRDDDGNPLCMQGLMYDITERKEAEERLVALDALKNTLLHTLSHDLKEPLTAILGAASTLDRLGESLDPGERNDLLRTMVERTKGMNSLLTDLLDLDRLDRGIVEPRRFPVELGDLTRAIVARTDVLRERCIDIDEHRCSANLDAAKVERLIENLLINAGRHTPPDARIWVRLSRDDAGATIVVEDDGPGIAEEYRSVIFQPFRRGPDTPTRRGSGIGLSLVARFAELHGGRAWVEPRAGGGSSFHVFLPDHAPPPDPRA